MIQDTAIATAEDMIEEYAHVYRLVHGTMPSAHYIRDGFFRINGQTIHARMLRAEIDNLHHLARHQRMQRSSKSAIHRLIAKLRGKA